MPREIDVVSNGSVGQCSRHRLGLLRCDRVLVETVYTHCMFDPAVFAARRDAYMQALGPGAVAVVRSLPERLRNGDAYHPFRQISDLYYLTGFVEPETTLVIRPGHETERI